MSADLQAVIAATTRWLLRAYPAPPGAMSATLAEAQARQATTIAAWLRYPTTFDVGLMMLSGPGGSERLDWVTGTDLTDTDEEWRGWVDEVVASWAACLLADPRLASAAAELAAGCQHVTGVPFDFRRLTRPDERDREATPLLRHPDLLAPVARLHEPELLGRLGVGSAEAA
ncbi:hypothetical protein [Prauserella muralis]|uniref:Uncharacterized protein n=1 Tax=Prauserella muralis TaxID=588067 RepID=A0A2V4APQ8_9PSEU|nr:hypothetical protein [Prauserella muralis]PXY22693.1 hypothetical protein BAY60_23040 [Prauserella muralis]TWE28409.1 hypothetical protein FHX69_1064 [Prauserella muralis]